MKCVTKVLALALFLAGSLQADSPKVLDSRYSLELISENPNIVTPIGMCIDDNGTLLIIESHTHHPKGKQPFPHDRIRSLVDADGDGKPEKWGTFYEGSKLTMSIRKGPDGWIYIATRARIFRIKDTDNDGKADKEEKIADLDTEANYPHNGLCGLLFDGKGKLYFGIGENFAKPYKLIGKNNTLLGGGEGGNVYRCDEDGSNLEFYATGIWNPFALCFDTAGRLFCVDNDPDSSPPCRLLEIKNTADFGFQMRYGRAGTNPLQCWKGEIPGTTGMLYGTGEAPCDVFPFHGQLLVTSWGHNRIESYTYTNDGSSVKMKQSIVVQGDNMFRPVDFAQDKNGNLYFTDWVNRSYPVHGTGKIWKLTYKPGKNEVKFPPLSKEESENNMISLGKADGLQKLGSADEHALQSVIAGLALKKVPFSLLEGKNNQQKFAILSAMKWRIFANLDGKEDLKKLVDLCINDESSDIRFLGLRLITDYNMKEYLPALNKMVAKPGTTPLLFSAICAGISFIESGSATKDHQGSLNVMLKMLRNPQSQDVIKTSVLQILPLDQKRVKLSELKSLFDSGSKDVKREVVRLISFNIDDAKLDILSGIAGNESEDANIRADAILGLASKIDKTSDQLKKLAGDKNKTVALAAGKYVSTTANTEISSHPKVTDLKGWMDILDQKKGDPEAGWRVFFGPRGGQCYTCHKFKGKGAAIGPDLTTLSGQMSKERILESILQPSKEIGPLYEMWNIQLTDGSSQVGSPHGEKGKFNTFRDMQGKTIEIEKTKIKMMTPLGTSMMPPGLEKMLTYQELRDLIAMLMEK